MDKYSPASSASYSYYIIGLIWILGTYGFCYPCVWTGGELWGINYLGGGILGGGGMNYSYYYIDYYYYYYYWLSIWILGMTLSLYFSDILL